MAEHEARRRTAYLHGLAGFEDYGFGLARRIGGRNLGGRHHDAEEKWSKLPCVKTTGAPCASIRRKPASASMRPMRVTATPARWPAASTASRASAGAVKHSS